MLGYKKLLYSKLTNSFQDGCDTIVAGCTTYGATPVSNSPTDIVNAIKKIYTDRYNAGYNNGITEGELSLKTYALKSKSKTVSMTIPSGIKKGIIIVVTSSILCPNLTSVLSGDCENVLSTNILSYIFAYRTDTGEANGYVNINLFKCGLTPNGIIIANSKNYNSGNNNGLGIGMFLLA